MNGSTVLAGGDIIIALANHPVSLMVEVRSFLQGAQPAQEVMLTLLRDREELSIEGTLGQRPAALPF